MSKFVTPETIVQRRVKTQYMEGVLLFHPNITDAETIRSAIAALELCEQPLNNIRQLSEAVLFVSEITFSKDDDEIINMILSGDTVLFLNGFEEAAVIATRKWDKRAVAEPPNEVVIHGPREGFTEDFKTNLSLIERRLKSPSLAIVKMTIGRITNTNVSVMYLDNVADKQLAKRIINTLKKIDVDGIIDIRNLEAFLDERPYSIFRQGSSTEKPDIVAAKLLEGRIAIMIDGSPMVLTLPFLITEDFQSSEDYYQRHSYSSFLRILRYASILLALYLPAVYVTVQLYNFDILPIRLLVTMMNAVKGTPMPPLLEMLFVIILFEIIREASVRMPKAVGMAMSIVGALVLGETAVKAGLIGSPTIMITALSSIALFLVPQQLPAFSILRIIYTIVGGLLGLYGIVILSVYMIHYLANLDTYGSPMLAPFAPIVKNDLKDGLVKEPFYDMTKRPESIENVNPTRQGNREN